MHSIVSTLVCGAFTHGSRHCVTFTSVYKVCGELKRDVPPEEFDLDPVSGNESTVASREQSAEVGATPEKELK